LILLSSRPIVIAEDSTTDSAVRRLIYDAGDEIDDLLTLCEADITTKNEFLQKKYLNNFNIVREKIKIVEERDRIRNFQPPVTGEDIMKHFNINPCKEIGMIKKYIKESILNGKIQNSNEEALKLMIEKGKELGL
jgi:tRNA nucleotidyltransferase (CCA-adding enzyme)